MYESNKVSSQSLVSTLIFGFIAGIAGALVVLGTINTGQPLSGLTPLTVIEESQTIDVVKSISPSVVSIVVSKEISTSPSRFSTGDPFFDDFFGFDPFIHKKPVVGKKERRRVGGGSGFIVSADGMILTNRHVVDDEDATYTVVLLDDREFEARVLAKDPLNDIAVVKIDATDLSTLDLGDSNSVQIGQTVIAVGYSLGEFQNSVTKGIVSGINRRIVAGDGRTSGIIEGAIQTDAAINRGNSGGPLINLAGQVIGINTAVSQQGQLIGFAIPINSAKEAVDSVVREGRIVRPWLGIRYVLVTDKLVEANNLPKDHGALIAPGTLTDPGVLKDSPAEVAGLKERDIIFEIDGVRIDEDNTPANIIRGKSVGDVLGLKVQRDDEVLDIKVTLGELTKPLN